MEIALIIIFLTLFAGAFFLLVMVTAFYFWRRLKRRNVETNRQFSSTRSQFIENDSIDNNDFGDNDFAFAEASDYSETSKESFDPPFENKEAVSSMSFESASEGGGYTSDSSDSASSSYDSSSSSDSSSSDSGSSSSWD